METLPLIPNSSNYGVQRGQTVVQVVLPGGAPKTRVDHLNSWSTVTVEWILTRQQYYFLQMFYDTALSQGASKFFIDLITDKYILEQHEAVFLQDGPELTGQRGLAYFVSCELMVKPQPVNDELNRLRMQAFRDDPKVDLLAVFFDPILPTVEVFNLFHKVGEVVSVDLALLFQNPQLRDLTYSSDYLADGVLVVGDSLEGVVGTGQEQGDFPTTITATTTDGLETTYTFEWKLVPSDFVGIDEMEIGTTFEID